jgi:hypothetical protein
MRCVGFQAFYQCWGNAVDKKKKTTPCSLLTGKRKRVIFFFLLIWNWVCRELE